MAGATVLAPEVIAVFLGPHWGPRTGASDSGACWPVAVADRDHRADLSGYGLDGCDVSMGHVVFRCTRRGLRRRFALGHPGVAAIYAVLSALLLIPSLAIPCRLIGLPLAALWESIQLIAVSTAAMAAVVVALRWVLMFPSRRRRRDSWNLHCDGAAFYFLFMYYRRSAVFRDVLTLAGPRWSVLSAWRISCNPPMRLSLKQRLKALKDTSGGANSCAEHRQAGLWRVEARAAERDWPGRSTMRKTGLLPHRVHRESAAVDTGRTWRSPCPPRKW